MNLLLLRDHGWTIRPESAIHFAPPGHWAGVLHHFAPPASPQPRWPWAAESAYRGWRGTCILRQGHSFLPQTQRCLARQHRLRRCCACVHALWRWVRWCRKDGASQGPFASSSICSLRPLSTAVPAAGAVIREWLGPPLQVRCTSRMLESKWWLLMCCAGWRLGLRLRVLVLQTKTRCAGAWCWSGVEQIFGGSA